MIKRVLPIFVWLIAGCALLDPQSTVDLTGVDPTVRKLLSRDERQAAFDEVLSWQRYRGEKKYVEKAYGDVGHVVVCPQKSAPPMFAVFQGPTGRTEEGFSLLTARGEFVDFFWGANFLHPPDTCEDINGDGLFEIVTSFGCGVGTNGNDFFELLVVVPVTPRQEPLLAVAYGRGDHESLWRWRLGRRTDDGARPIHLLKQLDGKWRDRVHGVSP